MTLLTKKNSLVLSILFLCTTASSLAQQTLSDSTTKNPLALMGLSKAGPGDINANTPLMLDPTSTPMYDENFNLIDAAQFMNLVMSNTYVPEPYLDKTKAVKAFVMRKATDQEKTIMQRMQQGMPEEQSALIGTPMPSFEVTDIKGNVYQTSALKGKVIVLNFWFVECKPCVMEIPELNEISKLFKKDDIIFLGLATNQKKQLIKFLKTTPFYYKIVPESQQTAQLFNVSGYPTSIIINKEGIIQYVSLGVGPNNTERLTEEINKLLLK
jgi:thiol-disulfide isomerase/thioredoxin